MTAGWLLSEAARRVSRHTGIAEATGVVVSVRCRRSGKGRGSVAVGFVFQMFEDSSDDTRLGDEGDDSEFPTQSKRTAVRSFYASSAESVGERQAKSS